jgi:hypothetical protein
MWRCGSEEMVRGNVACALEAKIVNGSVDRAARQAASTHRPFPPVSSPDVERLFITVAKAYRDREFVCMEI